MHLTIIFQCVIHAILLSGSATDHVVYFQQYQPIRTGNSGDMRLVWLMLVIWLGQEWSRLQQIISLSEINWKTRVLKWNSRLNMPPTLFHKLFNKRNVFTPPPKCDKDKSAFRYAWIFTLWRFLADNLIQGDLQMCFEVSRNKYILILVY